MPGRRVRVAWIWLVVAGVLEAGCGASAPVTREYVPAEIQPGLGESIVSESSVDTTNRYLSTVAVDGGRGQCSGVLVAPRLVLTAGHCVCSPHAVRPEASDGGTLIDKAVCSRTATVRIVAHKADGTLRFSEYVGTVRPHEEIEILYDAQNKELSSRADVAVLVLTDRPTGVKPVPLAMEQVQSTQPVTLVGYGEDGSGGRGVRRFGFNEVATIEESGSTFLVGKPVLFRQPYRAKELLLVREKASYSRKGDSGGPCLREKGGKVELVGIAKTYYGSSVEVSEYTSVYFHQKWIRAEIARAERVGAD